MNARVQRFWPGVVLAALAGLLLIQALFYFGRSPLSLGPRVILQPWLLRDGFLMYENIADQHSPLMPLLLSALRPRLDGLEGAKLVLVALVSLTTWLTFWVGRCSGGWWVGLGAAFFFVLWSPAFGYGKLWHESFLAPLYLLFLLPQGVPTDRLSTKSLLLLGLVGGTAILFKQQAALVFAAFILWRTFTDWSVHRSFLTTARDAAVSGLAGALPIIAFAAYHYARAGSLDSLLYWTIGFNLASGYASLAAQGPQPGEVTSLAAAALLLVPALFSLLAMRRIGDPKWLNLGWGFVLLAAAGFSVYPRFEMFHLQPALPILAWLSMTALMHPLGTRHSHGEFFTSRSFAMGTGLAIILFWVALAVVGPWAYLFDGRPQVVAEYSNLQPLAAQMQTHIAPADRIYVFPDDEATANLYYLLRRLPPRFWVLGYPWYLQGSTEQRMLQVVQENPPEWVVYFPDRWNAEEHAPELFSYIVTHYPYRTRLNWEQGDVWLLGREAVFAALP